MNMTELIKKVSNDRVEVGPIPYERGFYIIHYDVETVGEGCQKMTACVLYYNNEGIFRDAFIGDAEYVPDYIREAKKLLGFP